MNQQDILKRPSERAAVLAMEMGTDKYVLDKKSIRKLYQTAECSPKNLLEAMEYVTGNVQNSRLILLATYFAFQYPKGQSKNEQKGMGKVFKAGTPGIAFEGEDVQNLKRYEGLLFELLAMIYQNVLEKEQIDHMIDAATQDRVDAEIRKLARMPVNCFLLRLIAGCAFLNYTLSARIQNVLSICLVADMETALEAMDNMDLRGEMKDKGGNFDTVFGIDSRKLIKWAAEKNKFGILKVQFGRRPDVYFECMDAADFEICRRMAVIVGEMDTGLYQKWQDKEQYRNQLRVAEFFASVIETFAKTAGSGLAEDIRGYLRQEKGAEVLYACKEMLQDNFLWNSRVCFEVQKYQNTYGYDAFSRRCETMILMGNGYGMYDFFNSYCTAFTKLEQEPKKVYKRLFGGLETEGVKLSYQLGAYQCLFDSTYLESQQKALKKIGKQIFGAHLENSRDEMLDAFRKAGSIGRTLALEVMEQDVQRNREEILSFAKDTSKKVRETLERILYGQKDWEAEVSGLLLDKKASAREVGIRVIGKWMEEARDDGREKYMQLLTQALEKEKNTKVRDLLEKFLPTSGDKSSGNVIAEEDLVKELHKGNRKRVLAWAYGTVFPKVHKKNGKEAEEAYLQAILLCYVSLSPCGVSQSASFLAKSLDEGEFEVYVNELFDRWMAAGAEAKKRWVLYAAAIHGGDEMVGKLYHQIQEWPKEARRAIAVEAVQALSLSPKPQALLIVDQMSRKFKYKQIKIAAGRALQFAAAQFGITAEELSDRIVPDLGFDQNMQRVFDYGMRKFTVTVTTILEIEVYDEDGVKLKRFPAPGKRDDEGKAAAAYEEFKELKKQLKTVASNQKMRLEMALSSGRQWSVQAWKALFVEKPIMHQFAIGLVWGVYEDGKLIASFRYMEDGSFNTEEEEDFLLPEDVAQAADGSQSSPTHQGNKKEPLIGLVHPTELSEASLKAWQGQLADYEVMQPIVQLHRPVYPKTQEEANLKSLERFKGIVVNGLALGGKLTALGWYRGKVRDTGRFSTYYRDDPGISLRAELHFSGSFVGNENTDVTVYEIKFYRMGNLSDGSDAREGQKVYSVKDLPDRYFSEIVLQVSQAVASGNRI